MRYAVNSSSLLVYDTSPAHDILQYKRLVCFCESHKDATKIARLLNQENESKLREEWIKDMRRYEAPMTTHVTCSREYGTKEYRGISNNKGYEDYEREEETHG